MKTYDVYSHPSAGIEVVKKGFSWPGFFLTLLWAFVKKMPGRGFALLAILMVPWIMDAVGGSHIFSTLGGLAAGLWAGTKGNQWRAARLRERDYDHLGTVSATSPEDAVTKAYIVTVQAQRVQRPCQYCAYAIDRDEVFCRNCERDVPAAV